MYGKENCIGLEWNTTSNWLCVHFFLAPTWCLHSCMNRIYIPIKDIPFTTGLIREDFVLYFSSENEMSVFFFVMRECTDYVIDEMMHIHMACTTRTSIPSTSILTGMILSSRLLLFCMDAFMMCEAAQTKRGSSDIEAEWDTVYRSSRRGVARDRDIVHGWMEWRHDEG